ncbi:MAG: leucyl aminopeptidase family protein, partial [Tateyamaria sp.]
MTLRFAARDDATRTLHVLEDSDVADWLADQDTDVQDWIKAHRFTGAIGQAVLLPGAHGAVIGFGNAQARRRARFHLAAGAARLPKGRYALVSDLPADTLDVECLGWLLAGYRFDRYKDQSPLGAELVAADGVDAARIEAIAQGEALTRTLINTPAADMGPPDLEKAARDLAERHGAHLSVITGDDLITQNFPMIHAVGRAASRAPRLLDLTWGDSGPKVTL